MSDLISRQDAVKAIKKMAWENDNKFGNARNILLDGAKELDSLPSAKPEPLTDKEQRIFLAAMGREEKVCKEVDEECRNCREPYEDSLVRICHEITRKVKGALWNGK